MSRVVQSPGYVMSGCFEKNITETNTVHQLYYVYYMGLTDDHYKNDRNYEKKGIQRNDKESTGRKNCRKKKN